MQDASRKTLEEVHISTDVLVVGAGAGGLMAAISAADCGAGVTLCEIGNARRSGGIGGGNDHFGCYIEEIHGPELKERLVKQIANVFITDEDIIQKRVELAHIVLEKWEDWGVNMKRDGHYEFTGHGWPGSSGKTGEPGKTDRVWIHFSDNSLCPKLEKQARKRDVNIMNRVMITELLKNSSGRVVGAIGISTREPKLFVFQTKTVIINKGGVNGSRLYPPPQVKGYSMAQPGAGDGVIAAYRAGADIQNAEFCMRQISLRFGPWAGKGTWVGVVRDSEGKPIAPPYLSEPDAEIGDVSVENADAFDLVWKSGRGPVWMDPRGISEEDEKYMKWGFESEGMNPFLRWVDRENIVLRKTRFEFNAVQPSTLIQTRVNANFRTNLEGLYSISPAELAGSAVGGFVSGEEAAKDSKNIPEFGSLEQNREKISQIKNQYEEILNREGHQFADWREAQWAIWQTMHCYALPPNRTENTLRAGHNQLLRLRELTQKTLKAGNSHDLYHCVEVMNLMDIAELVILAVNERKESKGQSRRLDYPFINPMLNKFLVINNREGKPSFRWETPVKING